ncbi:MAG: L,D-transpeptidase [Thermoflexales bacterium]|nr:L,D-transpeptidase [Thermoflexales bacterium]
MTDRITRRDFLKLVGGAIGAAAFGTPAALAYELEEREPILPPAPLGRVAFASVEIRELPVAKARLIRSAPRDEVLELLEQVGGQAVLLHNSTWYRTGEGYVYSSWVQPVRQVENIVEPYYAVSKFWGELTVPFSDSRLAPDPQAARFMRVYYSAVFRVVDAVMGKDGQWWYRLQEGITSSPGPYVPAVHIRRFDLAELEPISPGVLDKHIEVDLQAQTITAYESGSPVVSSRVSSGYGEFRTPRGKHSVLFKYPAVRMTGGTGSDFYDLPGVAFSTFFTWSGVAIHGTYWHNDYGRPRSHGCLNVPPDVARWFWRWTAPVAPHEEPFYYTPRDVLATTVIVT